MIHKFLNSHYGRPNSLVSHSRSTLQVVMQNQEVKNNVLIICLTLFELHFSITSEM